MKLKKHLRITIDSYNSTAKEYLVNVTQFEKLAEIDEFISLTKANGHILDLGCGPGHHSKIFVENGFMVTGIDLSSEMIKLARRIEPDADFHVMDMLELKFSPNRFDAFYLLTS